jgi:Tfp pilus assembly protein PilO
MSNAKLSMSPASPSQTMQIVGIILLMASIVATYLYTVPNLQKANEEYANSTATLADLNTVVDGTKAGKAKLDGAKRLLSGKGITVDFLHAIMPPTEDIPGVYLEMENVANTVGGVTNFTYQVGVPIADAKAGVKIPISVSAKGSYPNLKQLLARLETLERPLSFSSISLATSIRPEDAGAISLTASGAMRAHALSDAYSLIPSK